MAEPKLAPAGPNIFYLHQWYEYHRQAQDKPSPMMYHAYKALIHQDKELTERLNEEKLMSKGYCPTCTQYVPDWEGPVLA